MLKLMKKQGKIELLKIEMSSLKKRQKQIDILQEPEGASYSS